MTRAAISTNGDPDEGVNGDISLGPACSLTIGGTINARKPNFEDNPGGAPSIVDGHVQITYKNSASILSTAKVGSGPANNICVGSSTSKEGNCFVCRAASVGVCAANPSVASANVFPNFTTVPMTLDACQVCGDGTHSSGEQCDDHNLQSNDGCDVNCTLTACGNGITTSPACDDGNQVNGDGCDVNCTVSACGNGIKTPSEICDDGNLTNGDGCSSTCGLEAIFRVDSAPSGVGLPGFRGHPR